MKESDNTVILNKSDTDDFLDLSSPYEFNMVMISLKKIMNE